MRFLHVVADANDADYVEQLTPTTDADLDKLRPLFEAIKQFKPYEAKGGRHDLVWTHDHNFPYGDACREDLGEKPVDKLYAAHQEALELFTGTYLPTDDSGSCHTVTEVRVLTVANDEKVI